MAVFRYLSCRCNERGLISMTLSTTAGIVDVTKRGALLSGGVI